MTGTLSPPYGEEAVQGERDAPLLRRRGGCKERRSCINKRTSACSRSTSDAVLSALMTLGDVRVQWADSGSCVLKQGTGQGHS